MTLTPKHGGGKHLFKMQYQNYCIQRVKTKFKIKIIIYKEKTKFRIKIIIYKESKRNYNTVIVTNSAQESKAFKVVIFCK